MSVARFAGAEMGKMLGHGVDFGSIGQRKSLLEGKEIAAGIRGDAYVERAGIQAEADVESNKLTIDAQSKLNAAESQGNTTAMVGKTIGGALGNISFGGSSGGGGSNPMTPFSGSYSSLYS